MQKEIVLEKAGGWMNATRITRRRRKLIGMRNTRCGGLV